MFGFLSRPQRFRIKSATQALKGLMSAADKVKLDALGASPFTLSFTSTDQTITSAGALTLAHGLGVAPTLVFIYLVCQTNDVGYLAGEVVAIGLPDAVVGSGDRGCNVKVDATNLTVRFGSNANAFALLNGGSGVGANAVNANWKVRFKAWA